MSEAPERIWAWEYEDAENPGVTITPGKKAPAYIRADRFDEVKRQRDRLLEIIERAEKELPHGYLRGDVRSAIVQVKAACEESE